MSYFVKFKQRFAIEFQRFLPDQKQAIGQFLYTYQEHGLADQTKYQGRISPSWMNVPTNHPNHVYAKDNHLWHYHVGLPSYSGSGTWGQTSDWVLHFQWPDKGPVIQLVDLYTHHTSDKLFYLPSEAYLEDTSEPDMA